MKGNVSLKNQDCIFGAKKIENNTVDLMICDPPFGIKESKFDQHYKRNKENIIDGYIEAPEDYDQFTFDWMQEAKRIIQPNGALWGIMGHYWA